jgi:Asp/Glu/hydantoin racemase
MAHGSRRIARIHAMEASIPPIRHAFESCWPDAETVDILDTSLAPDLETTGLDERMTTRFGHLVDYALGPAGASAVLFTCSAFGAAIRAAAARVSAPVLTPNEAAFEDATADGRRIALIVTFAPSLDALRDELLEQARRIGRNPTVEALLAPGALAALQRGDTEEHDRLISATAARAKHCDTIVLGQFSMARAADRVRADSGLAVHTTPEAAARRLKQIVGARA